MNEKLEEWKKSCPSPCIDMTKIEDDARLLFLHYGAHMYDKKNTIILLGFEQLKEFTFARKESSNLLYKTSIYKTGYFTFRKTKALPCILIMNYENNIHTYYMIRRVLNSDKITHEKLKHRYGRNGALTRKIVRDKLNQKDYNELLKYVINEKYKVKQ